MFESVRIARKFGSQLAGISSPFPLTLQCHEPFFSIRLSYFPELSTHSSQQWIQKFMTCFDLCLRQVPLFLRVAVPNDGLSGTIPASSQTEERYHE